MLHRPRGYATVPHMSRPRLRHVADLAGVSEATVSRVVNDRQGVSPATRREVLSALRQLGYEPVGIRRPRTDRGLVGLIVPELTNPVFPAFAQAFESQLANEGHTTVLCTATPAGMHEEDEIQVLLEHGVDGIVIVSGLHADAEHDHSHYERLREVAVPLVVVNGRPPDLEIASISCDHRDASIQAVRHLTALGHRRIGLAMGPHRYVPAAERIDGFRKAVRATGADQEEDLVAETVYGVEGGHAAAVDLLSRGVTAIVCGSDLMALGAIRAVHEQDRAVPDDVSVLGFDDAGPWQFTSPPLSSLRQPIEPMAAAAVRLLGAQRRRPDLADELRFRAELVVRGSTGAAPR